MKQWLQKIDVNEAGSVNKLLVGNKSDLSTERAVNYNTAKVNQLLELFFKFSTLF